MLQQAVGQVDQLGHVGALRKSGLSALSVLSRFQKAAQAQAAC